VISVVTQRYTVISVVADVGPCLESFDGVPGYIPENFNDGELRYGVTTVDGCQLACQADSNCIRFSYITNISLVNFDSNQVCYLFNSRTRERLCSSHTQEAESTSDANVYLSIRAQEFSPQVSVEDILIIFRVSASTIHLHSVAEFF